MNLDSKSLILAQVMLVYYCNMSCEYCYQDFTKDIKVRKMSIDTFKNILRIFDGKKIDLNLYGGEPLLNQEIIAYMISDDFILPSFVEIISINTNGLLLNSKFLSFYKKFKDILVLDLSLDGNKEIHDYYRVSTSKDPTYDTIVHNLEYFMDKSHFSINFCVSPFASDKLFDAITNLKDLGFRNIKMMFLYEKDWSEQHLKYLIAECIKLKIYRGSMNINIFSLSELNKNECRDDFLQSFTFLPSGEIIPCPVWISKHSNKVPQIESRFISSVEEKYEFIRDKVFGDPIIMNTMNQSAICEGIQGIIFKKNKYVIENILRKVFS